ncbi:unnamed protein product [Adineta ricciae]|uniref:Uncharacterized protein n=1 Tax=Adineta ricciae TaxID=249248 RepID=A0A814J4Q4_ADIRI|nr:unnamed protein product [Adineta ricciae]
MRFLVFFLLLGTVFGGLSFEWDKFKRDYNKQYKTIAEENQRKQIFIENVNRMRAFQQNHPDATFTVGINHLMDRRIEELASGTKLPRGIRSISREKSINVKDLPETVDWRVKGVISPVFTDKIGLDVTAVVSTELVETLYAIETGKLIKGSISQIFDCCPQPTDAFDCIQKNTNGICPDSDYPASLGSCNLTICKPFATFDKINRLEGKNEDIMKAWIQESTLWAELNVVGEGFQEYTTGIYDVPSCTEGPIDYVVQIVGYGVEANKPYWICKHSWGKNWGENGFFRIARGKNMCRIAENVVQVANTKKSDGVRQYNFISIPIVLIVALVSRLIN